MRRAPTPVSDDHDRPRRSTSLGGHAGSTPDEHDWTSTHQRVRTTFQRRDSPTFREPAEECGSIELPPPFITTPAVRLTARK